MVILLPGQASDYTSWDDSADSIKQYKMGFFYFSNGNLSIRKACVKDLGKYDPEAIRSEDLDICFRLAQAPDWVAVRERGCGVRHKAKSTFAGFVKQMWKWGDHVGYPYAKTGIRGIYLYWISSSEHKIQLDLEIDNFPFLICMFFTDFHVIHLLIGFALVVGAMGKVLPAIVASVLALPFIWRYLYDERRAGLGLWKTCQLALLHYVANVVFTTATVFGALKHRVLLLPSSIFGSRGPDDEYQAAVHKRDSVGGIFQLVDVERE